MMAKLACENPEIRSYLWNLSEEQMSDQEDLV